MKLAMMINYSGDFHADVTRIQELEKAGLDLVWVPEAYSFDAISQVGYLAAKTERIEIGTGIINVFSRTATAIAQTAAGCDFVSDGRFILGLGASGPQVIEGFHGVPYEHPMPRIREYIEVCRMVWRREPVVYDGQTVQIPLPAGQGTGLGKPLKLINHPKRADIPMFWASLMGKSVTDTARHADGWLPIFFDPEKFEQVWGDDLARGLRRARPVARPAADLRRRHGRDRRRVRRRRRRPGARHGPADHGAVRRRHGRPGQELLQHDRQEVRLRRRGDRDPGPLPVGAQGGGGRGGAARRCSPAPTSSARSRTSPSASPPTARPASPTCRSTRSVPTR